MVNKIDDLGMSTRARRVLRQLGVQTLEEFLSLTKNRVAAVRGSGERTTSEILALQETLRQEGKDRREI